MTVVRRLHEADGPVSHQGRHYRLTGCDLLVTPVQRPIPLVLGGGGARMIRFAARHADTVAFVPKSLPGAGLDPEQFSAAAFQHKIDVPPPQAYRSGQPGCATKRSASSNPRPTGVRIPLACGRRRAHHRL